jgi:hypothetical protein
MRPSEAKSSCSADITTVVQQLETMFPSRNSPRAGGARETMRQLHIASNARSGIKIVTDPGWLAQRIAARKTRGAFAIPRRHGLAWRDRRMRVMGP